MLSTLIERQRSEAGFLKWSVWKRVLLDTECEDELEVLIQWDIPLFRDLARHDITLITTLLFLSLCTEWDFSCHCLLVFRGTEYTRGIKTSSWLHYYRLHILSSLSWPHGFVAWCKCPKGKWTPMVTSSVTSANTRPTESWRSNCRWATIYFVNLLTNHQS